MIIDVSNRYHSPGRVTFRETVHRDGSYISSAYAETWTMITQEDLGLQPWVGMGDRPRLSCFWVAIDGAGSILMLVPADNVAGFSAGKEPT